MLKSMQAVTTVLLVLLASPAPQAQDEVTQQETVIPRYTVEIIVFKYLQDVGVGSEIFPAERPETNLMPGNDEPSLTSGSSPEREDPKPIGNTALSRLASDQYTMRETRRRLDLLEAYDPVMHFGWTQATWPADQTRPISLGTLARPPAGFDGSLTLYLGRYLHLVVDLTLEAEQQTPEGSSAYDRAASHGDKRTLDDPEELAGPRPVRYRIYEDRILRSGEVRYYDHPKFGVLAKVTRVERDDNEDSTADSF